ncbi:amidohydrolase [Streptomyces diastatochromogenes]|uniref:Amidohydrolase n=1 Tax=Streptomyces diastatochromogenes TaxID=42236 RepID=A0A233SY46_STRDA|nr:amidohydrolase [Streptomyces diastatochromogenes]MCZ0991722.1 amidohydrolase [Streptomyces diastatochromogenes]OXZ00561.1 amidohydrolase [Streptomyces diastatochromogenes]
MSQRADLIVTNAAVYTCDPAREWAEAFAVAGGDIIAVGSADEVRALATPGTKVLDAGGRMVMPGLCDVHTHLGYGGSKIAHELGLLPTDTLDDILAKVRDRAAELGPDEWIVGGTITSSVLADVSKGGYLAAFDEASGGHPVILRDDSMHNRWVNSRALELIGVGADTPDPEDGTYVRDADGRLTGVLLEMASKVVEDAMNASIENPEERLRVAFKTALRMVNSFGITAAQDAGTLEHSLRALAGLDDSGEMTAWVVGSMPSRTFFEEGAVGEELYAVGGSYRRPHVRPDFVKLFLDGVPMTRTSALLTPYICHGDHEDPDFKGESYWSHDDLVKTLKRCYELGLGAKLHSTGDGSVRLALDAIETVRKALGDGPIFQIAHVINVHPDDVPRFAELNVVADASPYMWFPSVIIDITAEQVPQEVVERSFPCKDLVDSGAVLAAGSDWPVVPLPNPWLGMETLVTRANPDPAVPGELGLAQRLSLPEAIAAFTSNPAKAMGLGDTTGAIRTGLSADFVVLNHNLFDVEPGEIHQTQVEYTYFKGAKVYEKSPE